MTADRTHSQGPWLRPPDTEHPYFIALFAPLMPGHTGACRAFSAEPVRKLLDSGKAKSFGLGRATFWVDRVTNHNRINIIGVEH